MNLKFLAHVFFAILFSLTVSAQDDTTQTTTTTDQVSPVEITPPVAPRSSPNDGVEKLEVTGSHIKRVNVEGPSPILVLDRESLDKSGYNSVADVLRDSTITATGVARESAGGSAAGAATAGLRGFGSDKVLVLLNGNRLPKIGGDNAVDLNLIPFQGIERVEVLKDGASAVYGSDALAGVINFITKKDFDGASITMKTSVPEEKGGGRDDIAAIYGKNFSKGNIMAVYQYRGNKEIWDKDREWSRGGLSILGSPGSYRAATPNGVWRPDPRCPQALQSAPGANATTNNYCRYDFTPHSWTLPNIEQHSGIISGEYSINEELKTYANVIYTDRMTRWQYAPAPDTFKDDTSLGTGDFSVPNAIANGPGWNLGVPGGASVDVNYRLVDELGTRSHRDSTNSYGGTVGVKGFFSDTWEWDYNVTHGASKIYNNGFNGYADKSILRNLMLNNQFRPFDPNGSGDISSARHVSQQWIDSVLTMTQFKASGELAEFGGGILSAAFGGSGAWEEYNQRVDSVTAAGNLFGGSGGRGEASRNYQAIFTELAYAVSNWEFQLAGRYDHFSDFGGTFNPKFSFRYMPITQLMVRGSVGTGFKAPTLAELYAAQSYGFPWIYDNIGCDNTGGTGEYCEPKQYRLISSGNKRLKEETSFSYNLGTVYEPMKALSFSLDYWHTEINDAIGLNVYDLMLAEQRLGNAALPQYGVQVNRANGIITEIIAPSQNIAQQRADGLEFTADYVMDLGFMKVNPHVDHSHMLNYLEEPFPGLGMISKLGEAGRPRWRNTTYVTFSFLNDHSIRATGRTIAGQFKAEHTANRDDQRRTANYTEFDLNYTYNAFWNAQISLGAKNVFGTKRPLDDTAGFAGRLNTALYDQIGRLFYLGYTQNF